MHILLLKSQHYVLTHLHILRGSSMAYLEMILIKKQNIKDLKTKFGADNIGIKFH